MIAKTKKTRKVSRQNIFFPVLLGLLILGVVSFLIVASWKINQNRTEQKARIETLQEEIYLLEVERQQLQAQVSQTSEESFLEKEARETFNLKKPGEEVVVILPAEEEEIKEPEKGFWQKILEKIKFW